MIGSEHGAMPTSYVQRLQVAKSDIEAAFSSLPSPVLSQLELQKLIEQNRAFWRLGSMPVGRFIAWMLENSQLDFVRIDFKDRPLARFRWRGATVFELVQSINDRGYFSHFTAIHLHGLTDQIPKTIYFNTEQPGRSGGGTLNQAAIDRTFKGKCRTSSNAAVYQDRTICLLHGGNTENLGVESVPAPEGRSSIQMTNLERTLIDATIRPAYSGGIYQVRSAFEAAKERLSSNKMASYLKSVGYTYPFHQAIGLYMERTGYRKSQLDLMRQFPMHFDFYLDYGLRDTEFDSGWRIHVPKGF